MKQSNFTNILITGASGFVGSFLLESLIKDASNKIVALYNKSNKNQLSDNSDRIQWTKIDLIDNCNFNKILENIDVVYHLAGYSTIESTQEDIHLLEMLNVSVTIKIVKACVRSSVKQFIFVSSVAACEEGDNTIINESSGFPITEYGKSKRKAEAQILKILSNEKIAYTILRPTALFGENHEGSMLDLTRTIKKNKFVIFGDGKNITSFYYIRDFIDVLLKVKFNKKAYNEIFICSNNPMELNCIVGHIKDNLNSKIYVLHIPIVIGYIIAISLEFTAIITKKKYPLSIRRLKAMTRTFSYSNKKLIRRLNINNEIGLEEGLRKTISWYMKNELL